jgi:uncharacterized protein (TIGR03545 family)
MARLKLFRWQSLIPLGILFVLLGVLLWLFLDLLVERSVERSGTYIVGARVDLASADVRLGDGVVVLRGLQVTNPDAPMTNLIEAREIVLNVRMAPLLEKKLHVDTLALRDMRFGTPRAESGALKNPPPGSGQIKRDIDRWARQIKIPSFSLEGLGQVVNVSAIRPESLQTLAQARAIVAASDSMVKMWDQQIRALDPRPQIDSTRAFIAELRAADPARLGVAGITTLATNARARLTAVTQLRNQVAVLDSSARGGVADVRSLVQGLADARDADIAFARGLLKLPSLEGPQLSPAIFGEAALSWVKPVLYWMRIAEEYVPPGLNPRRYAGPRRARRRGTTVLFPTGQSTPRFLLGYGEASLALGGTGAAAGSYAARITGLTSDPILTRTPIALLASRTEAVRGPRDIRVAALLDHASRPIRDSLAADLRGISLPSVTLAPLGARLLLGTGMSNLSLARSGDQLDARWLWRSPDVRWERLTAATPGNAAALRIGTKAWADDLLWRTIAGIDNVEIDVRLSGTVTRPSLAVRSNVGETIAQSLRREFGREVERAEQQVRAKVDSLVQSEVARARAMAETARAKAMDEIAPRVAEVQQVEAQLDAEIRALAQRLPAGLRVPALSIPGLPRAGRPDTTVRDTTRKTPPDTTPPDTTPKVVPDSTRRHPS